MRPGVLFSLFYTSNTVKKRYRRRKTNGKSALFMLFHNAKSTFQAVSQCEMHFFSCFTMRKALFTIRKHFFENFTARRAFFRVFLNAKSALEHLSRCEKCFRAPNTVRKVFWSTEKWFTYSGFCMIFWHSPQYTSQIVSRNGENVNSALEQCCWLAYWHYTVPEVSHWHCKRRRRGFNPLAAPRRGRAGNTLNTTETH